MKILRFAPPRRQLLEKGMAVDILNSSCAQKQIKTVTCHQRKCKVLRQEIQGIQLYIQPERHGFQLGGQFHEQSLLCTFKN